MSSPRLCRVLYTQRLDKSLRICTARAKARHCTALKSAQGKRRKPLRLVSSARCCKSALLLCMNRTKIPIGRGESDWLNVGSVSAASNGIFSIILYHKYKGTWGTFGTNCKKYLKKILSNKLYPPSEIRCLLTSRRFILHLLHRRNQRQVRG